MKKMKRICTLLLAIVLTLSMSLQPDIGRAFADNIEQNGQITESAAKSADGAEKAGESTEQLFYEQLMACSSLSDFEALLCAEENSAVLGALNKEELNQLVARVDEICAAIADPTEADTFLKEKALKKLSEYTGDTYQANDEPGEAASPAKTEKKKAAAKAAGDETKYIYFDLAAGDVNIGKDKYSGWVYVKDVEDPQEVTGDHKADNKYYVYQSTDANRNETGYKKQEDLKDPTKCKIPKYDRVKYDSKNWTDYITNNINVEEVSRNWENAAKSVGRKPLGTQATNNAAAMGNRIIFANASKYEADVTIDNIWTYYQTYGNNRNTGGITAHLEGSTDTKIYIRLKGDNRFGNVHYGANENSRNQIIFSNGEPETQAPGSITVADFPQDLGKNHWASAIGGDDGDCDRADGIVIDSGVIYAGTTAADNCTAIGGGGNEYGRVTINNGTVTAVAATTGTAIGGGIGWSGGGGNADVTINEGTVYAYNMGIHETKSVDKYEKYVPAVAIGGGSSQDSGGNAHTTVTIEGGKVYAQSMGGAAIGGGGSTKKAGGKAIINIKGGTIIAKSTSGTFRGTKDDDVVNIPAGVSIGGGTGLTGGGSVELNISGGILRTGSIGGGSATGKDKDGNPYNIGSANVKIEGGDITGQVVMAGGQGSRCIFNMSDGTIHNTNVIEGNEIKDINDPNQKVPITYIEKNGGAVFMDDPNGETTITGGTIEYCKAVNGGAIYMEGGTANINGGSISNNTATEDGGGIYLPGGKFTMNAGVISGNTADKNGGGFFLSKEPTLNKGTIEKNTAKENGGGMYISGCIVNLKPTNKLNIAENHAQNGGGIYIHKEESGDSGGTSNPPITIDAKSNASPIDPGAVGLDVNAEYEGFLSFTNNIADDNGGAVCIDGGRFLLESNQIEVKGNQATNGGGVAAIGGNFTMFKGSIGEKDGGNTATEIGGGVYVSGGDVWLRGGSVKYNEAASGGGIGIQDGKVYMYDGSVDKNTATTGDGGGIYLSSTSATPPLVDILSGSISSNKAYGSGGGIAVSSKTANIKVNVGVNCEHKFNNDGTLVPFEYKDDECGSAHDTCVHAGNFHNSCPVVMNNEAGQKGGGFFLDSPKSHITIYCLLEQGNTAEKDPNSNCMDVEGGILQIGDKDFDIHEENHPTSDAKGNTTMQGTIMVEGGQVDIYGEMENPKFIDDVKVDVQNKMDHYVDHRIIKTEEVEYKVHYYENFKGEGDTPTGLYIARQYPDEEHASIQGNEKYDFTIMSSLFSHPGYKIVGWNTKADDSGENYEVNSTHNLKDMYEDGKIGADISANGETHRDGYLFVLYAIWERNGYVLKFDPNVGTGETYTGTMKNQNVTVGLLDGTQKISENQFKRTGYKFMDWTLNPNPTDAAKVYSDKAEITEDFTQEDGATVTLYAKWEKCTHVDYLVYTADGNVLTQSCSACGSHTATATLSAVNSAYDGNEHLATADFSDNWLSDRPKIAYEMAASEWDSKDQIDDNWSANPKPIHAGTYTAKITGENQTDAHEKVTVQVEYTISPVKWETPAVPTILFKYENGKSLIEVNSPTGNNMEYWIQHLDTTSNNITSVTGYENWKKNNQFSDITLGYYYFYAKRCADRDHLESNPSRSEAYLAAGGNIVYIKNDTGINVVPSINSAQGTFVYTVSADADYHLRDYEDNSDIASKEAKIVLGHETDAVKVNDNSIVVKKTRLTNETYEYTVEFKKDEVMHYQVTLKFSGAAKDASVTHKVTDGQVFRDFNGKETSISCDSAFTAQFTVSDYIPDEYNKQELLFSKELPTGTTVIMKANGGYWYQKLDGAKNSINLTDFIAMGGEQKFCFNTEIKTAVEPFTYQFIVDFSQVIQDKMITAFNLDVSLGLTAIAQLPNSASQSAPTIPEGGKTHISLDIKDKAKFELTPSNVNGKSATLNCDYTASAGAASIWNGRDTALVLTAAEGTNIPADLTLTAVVGENTTHYTMNSEKQFIIPLGDIGNREEVNLTLSSNTFGSSEKNLTFTAEWYVSQSGAGKSPLNGYQAALCDVNFSCQKDAVPSVRIVGKKHRCEVGGKLNVTVEYKGIPSGGTVTAYLQKKDGEKYIDTAAKSEINKEGKFLIVEGEKETTFYMGEMGKGSYCILVIVNQDGANILQVPYYFIIV